MDATPIVDLTGTPHPRNRKNPNKTMWIAGGVVGIILLIVIIMFFMRKQPQLPPPAY